MGKHTRGVKILHIRDVVFDENTLPCKSEPGSITKILRNTEPDSSASEMEVDRYKI